MKLVVKLIKDSREYSMWTGWGVNYQMESCKGGKTVTFPLILHIAVVMDSQVLDIY